MRSFAIAALVATASAAECDQTTCDLVTSAAGYKVIRVTHPTNGLNGATAETVCVDNQAAKTNHVAAKTKHCAITSAGDCECHQFGTHPNGDDGTVDHTGTGWSGSDGTGTATNMDHANRPVIKKGLDDHAAIDNTGATDPTAAAAIAQAAMTRDGTDYAAHDGHVTNAAHAAGGIY